MDLLSSTRKPAGFPLPEEISEQVQRVLASSVFRGSEPVRQLLGYLADRAVRSPAAPVKEYELATEGLGRSADYDPRSDASVRLVVGRLRLKLAEYYGHEGAGDPVILDVPKGSYLLSAVHRSPANAVRTETLRGVRPAPLRDYRTLVPWSLAAVLAILCALLGWQDFLLRANQRPPSAATPYVDHLWHGIFGNGRESTIVTSDANLMFFSNFLAQPAGLGHYRGHDYPTGLLNANISNPEVRRVMTRYMSTFFTTSQDALAAGRLSRLAGLYGIPLTTQYARDVRLDPTTPGNLILLGHKKADPWVELFESKMNFIYAWDPERSQGLLLNRQPMPGESEKYPLEQGKSNATILYTDSLGGGGSVLILEGNDMTSVDVGARFLCEEASVRALHRALGADLKHPIPHFEALLVAHRVHNTPYDAELLATRVSR